MTKPTAEWMPFYWADYLRDTQHLTTEEHGAYMLLIGVYWSQQAPLKKCTKLFQTWTKTGRRKWAGMAPTILAFFDDRGDGLLRHKRIDQEIDRAVSISNSRKLAGSVGGRASSEKRKALDARQAIATPSDRAIATTSGKQLVQQTCTQSTVRDTLSVDTYSVAARDEPQTNTANDAALRLIEAFDKAIKATWPDNARAWPATTDLQVAQSLAEAGIDASTVESVALARCAAMRAKGKQRPSALSYLRNAFLDAAAEKAQAGLYGARNGHAAPDENFGISPAIMKHKPLGMTREQWAEAVKARMAKMEAKAS